MANRITYIKQKRASLNKQLESLQNTVAENEFDLVEARLRLDRIRTLFHAYEELHDELVLLEIDNEGVAEMDAITKAFYTIAAKIESIPPSDSTNPIPLRPEIPMGNSTFIEQQRQLKLPIAELPKFDGNLEEWLSFKNTFKVMIESRTDISDLVKFMYLKNCLTGEAANKIGVYNADNANYKNAWTLLTEAYERKRILLSKHLDAILDIPRLIDTSAKGVSKMVDTVRQHITMLGLLDFSVSDYVIVRTLEKALPNDIRLKWEESLSLDAVPTLKEFYTFIGGVVFRLQTMEREAVNNKGMRGEKRAVDHETQGGKRKRVESRARALATTTSNPCYQCQADHPLYRCPVFEKMTVQQKWDLVKAKKLCRNCLRKHSGECKSIKCKHCNRFHHSQLHYSRPNASAPKIETSQSTSKSST